MSYRASEMAINNDEQGPLRAYPAGLKQMDAGKVRGAPLVRGAARPAPPAAAPFNSRVRGVEGRGP